MLVRGLRDAPQGERYQLGRCGPPRWTQPSLFPKRMPCASSHSHIPHGLPRRGRTLPQISLAARKSTPAVRWARTPSHASAGSLTSPNVAIQHASHHVPRRPACIRRHRRRQQPFCPSARAAVSGGAALRLLPGLRSRGGAVRPGVQGGVLRAGPERAEVGGNRS